MASQDLTLVRKKVSSWDGAAAPWKEEATAAFSIVAGDQWDETAQAELEEAERPVITFNRIAALIRGICGLEVSNRQEVRYLPREMGDVNTNDINNAAAKWVRDECAAGDEESEAFRDMLICGMGWMETRLDYDHDPDGVVVMERLDPMEMRWDPAARKRGLIDARWVAHCKRMSVEEIKERWPDKSDDISIALTSPGNELLPHRADDVPYAGFNPGGARVQDEVEVVQYQYHISVPYTRVLTLEGQIVDLPTDRYRKLANQIPVQRELAIKKRVYRQKIYAGDVELEDIELKTDGFTLHAITGIRDRNAGTWYGLVRDLIDPQRWSNKFFSSMLDTVSTSAKGGLMAEKSAFVDPRRAEDDWANPRSIIWLNDGMLDRVRERGAAPVPAGLAQLMEFAINSMPQISGVNLEFLGLANRAQAGVLEFQRKQSTITTLAEFFAALSLYRKQQGKILLQMIQEFLSDGRLIRIVGQEGEQYVPLMRGQDIDYDVIVDDMPTSPDIKARTWMALTEVLPMAMKAGVPVPPEILDYAPIPSTLAAKWKQLLSGQNQVSPQHRAYMDQMTQQMQKLAEENQQLKTRQQERMMELAADREKTVAELAAEREKTVAELALEREKASAELQLEQERVHGKLAMEREAAMIKLELEREEQQHQLMMEREKQARPGSQTETISIKRKDGSTRTYMVSRDAAGNTTVS